jgi:hypothetical protein
MLPNFTLFEDMGVVSCSRPASNNIYEFPCKKFKMELLEIVSPISVKNLGTQAQIIPHLEKKNTISSPHSLRTDITKVFSEKLNNCIPSSHGGAMFRLFLSTVTLIN